ncbi:MAG: FxsA family protein [Pseudomonadota bacterium]
MRWFFLLLPWLELFSLIKLGQEIGALNTLFYVLASMMLGIALLRRQGLEILTQMRSSGPGAFPTSQLFLGQQISLVLAGVLLFIPGLFTDTIAMTVIVLAALRAVLSRVGGGHASSSSASRSSAQNEPFIADDRSRASNQAFRANHPGGPMDQPRRGDTFDGEYSQLDDS